MKLLIIGKVTLELDSGNACDEIHNEINKKTSNEIPAKILKI